MTICDACGESDQIALTDCAECGWRICAACALDSDCVCPPCYRARNRRELAGLPRIVEPLCAVSGALVSECDHHDFDLGGEG